jgi:hypothetical protein
VHVLPVEHARQEFGAKPGTLHQLGLFSILAVVFLPLVFGLLILQFFLSAGTTPVYVVNR